MAEDFVRWLIKQSLKPGYLYGIGEDGELYQVEAKIPKPGETVIQKCYMPKEGEGCVGH